MLSLSPIMKTILFYIFFLGLFFLNLSHQFSSVELKHDSLLKDSFVKMNQEDNSIVSDASQNTTFFFENDLFNDDEVTSVKKKIFFVHTPCLDSSQYGLSYFCNNLYYKVSRYAHFSCLPLANYLSLRVLRL